MDNCIGNSIWGTVRIPRAPDKVECIVRIFENIGKFINYFADKAEIACFEFGDISDKLPRKRTAAKCPNTDFRAESIAVDKSMLFNTFSKVNCRRY